VSKLVEGTKSEKIEDRAHRWKREERQRKKNNQPKTGAVAPLEEVDIGHVAKVQSEPVTKAKKVRNQKKLRVWVEKVNKKEEVALEKLTATRDNMVTTQARHQKLQIEFRELCHARDVTRSQIPRLRDHVGKLETEESNYRSWVDVVRTREHELTNQLRELNSTISDKYNDVHLLGYRSRALNAQIQNLPRNMVLGKVWVKRFGELADVQFAPVKWGIIRHKGKPRLIEKGTGLLWDERDRLD